MPQKDQGSFLCFSIIDGAQCATPATLTQMAGVAYATHAPPLAGAPDDQMIIFIYGI